MDLEDYVNILHGTEQKHDVNKYVHSGMKIWPLFRSQTISMFRNPEAYFAKANKKNDTRQKYSIKDKILSAYYSRKFRKEFIREELAKTLTNSFDILLYCKPNEHKDILNGELYDRFLDPFHEKLCEKNNLIKLQLNAAEEKNTIEKRHVKTVFLDHKKFKDHFYYKYKYKQDLNLSQAHLFEEIKKDTGLEFVSGKIDSAFQEVIYYRELFRLILPVIKPRIIFFQGYYENDTFGLMAAARELGIKTVDIQHGKQGAFHPMYTHWTKIPENGYELLPDFFWNWGKESSENIEEFMNRKDKHMPVTGGNLWVAKWKKKDVYNYASAEEQEFADSLKKFERIILFTTQPLDEAQIFPPHVLESIRKSDKNWIWLIRTHPFQKISEQRIRDIVGQTDCSVEIKFSSSIPLYQLFKLANHHVTLWSSTCFEANEFGLKTSIVSEFGYKLYEKYIKENVFSFSVSADELIGIILKGSENKKLNYIETSADISDSAFEKLNLRSS